MKNRQGIIWAPVLIMIAAVVVVGVAGYFMFQASKPSTENANVAVVNIANSNVNTNSVTNINPVANSNTAANTNSQPDTTAGWKTYTNTTYNISFQYPNDWKVAEGATSTAYKIDVFPNTSSGWSTSGAITFWVGNSYTLRCGESPKTTTTQTVIGGIPATLYTTVDQKAADCKFRTYQLSRIPTGWTRTNGGSSEIQVMATKTGSYTIQDSILATLKLSDPTADWKTYTSSKYHFSLKYPPTWSKQEVASTNPDGSQLFFTQFSDDQDQAGAFVVSYLNSPVLFQDGIWNSSSYDVTSVGGRQTTSILYSPDTTTGTWAVTPHPKVKISFTDEPDGWDNRSEIQDVNGTNLTVNNGDIQLLAGPNDSFTVLRQILSTFQFTD